MGKYLLCGADGQIGEISLQQPRSPLFLQRAGGDPTPPDGGRHLGHTEVLHGVPEGQQSHQHLYRPGEADTIKKQMSQHTYWQ